MAETYYELEERSHAVMRKVSHSQPGFTPLHVIKLDLPTYVGTYKINLSTVRPLTLMEWVILSVSRDVGDVKLSEVCNRMGFHPDNVESTINSLLRSKAIEIEGSPSVTNIDWKNFTEGQDIISINDSGRKFLIEEKIADDDRMERNFDFVYSIFGDRWFPATGGFERGHMKPERNFPILRGGNNEYLPYEQVKPPTIEQVTDLLKSSGQFDEEEELEVTSAVNAHHDGESENGITEDSKYTCQVYVTLASSSGGDACFFVHSQNLSRLESIEEIISSSDFNGKILQEKFRHQIPPFGDEFIDDHSSISSIHNLAHSINTLADEDNQTSPVFFRKIDFLPSLNRGSEKALQKLRRNRTTIEVVSGQFDAPRELKVIDEGPPRRFSLADSNFQMDDLSISSENSAFRISNYQFKISGLVYKLPVLLEDWGLQAATSGKILELRTDSDDPLTNYFFSGEEVDLERWINSEVDKMKDISEVPSILSEAEKHTKAHGRAHDYRTALFTRLLYSKKEIFGKDRVTNCIKLIEEIGKSEIYAESIWPLIEPILQQSVFDSSYFQHQKKTDLFEIWNNHYNLGSSELAWEDAAKLEDSIYGHTRDTRFQIAQLTEEIISQIHDLEFPDDERPLKLATKLDNISHIVEKKLDPELTSKIRLQRNHFIHSYAVASNARLAPTLEAILVARKLSSFLESESYQKEKWKTPSNKSWTSPKLSPLSLGKYLDEIEKIMVEIESLEIDISWDIWLDPLENILPIQFNEYPIESLKSLVSISLRDQESKTRLDDLIEHIHKISKSSAISTIPDGKIFSKEATKVRKELATLGLSGHASDLINSSVSKAKKPANLNQMANQAKQASELSWDEGDQQKKKALWNKLNGFWTQSVKSNSDFSCTVEDLIADSPLDGELTNKTREKLLTTAINSSIGAKQITEPGNLEELFRTILNLKSKSEGWGKTTSKLDGYISSKMKQYSNLQGDEVRESISKAFSDSEKIVAEIGLDKTHKAMMDFVP